MVEIMAKWKRPTVGGEWLPPKIDRLATVLVRVELIRASGSQPGPAGDLVRNAVQLRLLLWSVLVESVTGGDDPDINTAWLINACGLGSVAARKKDGKDLNETQRVDRGRRALVRKGLVGSGVGIRKTADGLGCGVRFDRVDGGKPSSSLRPGNPWRQYRGLAVPATFWTRGWVGLLEPTAVLMFLVLLDVGADRSPRRVPPKALRARYQCGPDTRRDGLEALVDEGLAAREVVPGTRQSYRYALTLSGLTQTPRSSAELVGVPKRG